MVSPTTLVSTNKVLLVEDNPGDARLVEIFLQESDLQNCEVVNKTSLADAIAILESGEEFAVILLDLTLPDSRGFETLERLLAKFPQKNIIVLTGYSDKEMGLRAVQAGAQDFLVKGAFDAEQLSKSLRFSIERTRVLKRLEETQRIARIGNWEYFPETSAFTATDEFYRIFGHDEDRLDGSGNNLEEVDSPIQALKELHEVVAVKGSVKQDMKIKQKGGAYRYVSVQCNLRHDEANNLVYQGIIQDITDRKLADMEMEKSRARYQEIFTQSKDALFISTFTGKFVDFNQATLDVFGYSREELQTMEDTHKLYYPVERKNEFLLKLKAQKAIKDFEISIAHRSGEVRECMMTATIIVTDDFIGYNCILRDVTELRQAERMRKTRDLAQQSAYMKEQFLASISHEMRTPMNAIFGMSNILLQMNLPTEQNGLVQNIKNSSEILLGVVNDILEISAIQNGKVVFENKPFDLAELLNNLINVMQYKAQEKDIFLEVITSPDVPRYISGDKLRLNQVLYNLVGNAIKFTDHGFVKIYIEKLYDIGNSVQLKFKVQDTGIGISEDKIEAIFETFTRILRKDRVYEGTGLGLSICKNLIEQQGGKIGATSTEGKGSVFYFDLIVDMASAEDLDNKEPQEPENELPANAKFKLLLAEDHKMNQLVARKTLERKWKDIEITIADNGQIAIDLLRENIYDIVLMDIQMPIMDGYEATKTIRNTFPPDRSNMIILAMTAHAHVGRDEKYKEYGMDDFVLKPFDPEDLFYKISKYVKHR
ncbi:MAG: response regulator [Saprospiraceae bacterium]|jgi:PAS domain S-box-containing protein|nr:response regulator [Saprospiraceae bacterium]